MQPGPFTPEVIEDDQATITIDQRMRELMHQLLLENLVSPHGGFVNDKESRIGKSRDSDEIRATINGQQYVLIVPTGIKHAPALESRIRECNRQGIATRVIVPESSEGYVGRHIVHIDVQTISLPESVRNTPHIQHQIAQLQKKLHELPDTPERAKATERIERQIEQCGRFMIYPLSVLSSIVKYMVDKYGGRSVYAFALDPEKLTTRTMQFNKRPEEAVASYLGIAPYSEGRGDDALVKYVRALREYDREKGYLYRHLDPEDEQRFTQLGWIRDDQCTIRGRFKPEAVFKFAKPGSKRQNLYTLKAEKHHSGILLAHIVPYKPQQECQLQATQTQLL